MAIKKYTIDFFLVDIRDQQNQPVSFTHILEQMQQGDIGTVTHYADYHRDIWGIHRSPAGRYSAQFRKLRQTDLPEIGEMGTQSQPIHLAENQGVIEKNCFMFDPELNIIAWHNNLHAATPKALSEVLSLLTQKSVKIYPIIKLDSFRQLLENRALTIKNIDIAFAKPTNPEAFNTNEPISGHLLNLLTQTGADKLDLKLAIDARMNSSSGSLSQTFKDSLNALLNLSPSRARLHVRNEVEECDFPIDLIMDRVRSFQKVNVADNITSLPSILLFEAIEKAFDEVNTELNEIVNRVPPRNTV